MTELMKKRWMGDIKQQWQRLKLLLLVKESISVVDREGELNHINCSYAVDHCTTKKWALTLTACQIARKEQFFIYLP